jgi:beta-phosphoglucomutase-like phosphatase (HAD superfamily)
MTASFSLILDCDGVLADTERYGHLPAFNAAFAELGVPMRWTEDDYAELVLIGGGKERIAAALRDPKYRLSGSLSDVDDERVRTIHGVKTRIYKQMVADGVMPARPGVARLIRSALGAGWNVAIASTSTAESVTAVLHSVIGDPDAQRVPVFAGDAVTTKKPAPDIYLLAVDGIGAEPTSTIVVEDSAMGLRAAVAAGLPCLVTTSSYTVDEDFTGSAAVVTCLGDDSHPALVRSDPFDCGISDFVDLDVLQRLITMSGSRSLSGGFR